MGPRELAGKKVVAVARDTFQKSVHDVENLNVTVPQMLQDIQQGLFNRLAWHLCRCWPRFDNIHCLALRAKEELDASISLVDSWEEFCNALDESKVLVHSWA